MAAVNFPNPAATNPDTGRPYSEGWYNADNGVTYIYEDNAWKAAASPGDALDDTYVEVAGDNMTGPLTIGPDGGPAVTTLADDGSATFTCPGIDYGYAYVFGVTGTGDGKGGLRIEVADTSATAPALSIAGGGLGKAQVNGDGSAEFASSASFAGGAAYIYPNGSCALQNNNGGKTSVLTIRDADDATGTSRTIILRGQGYVEIGGTLESDFDSSDPNIRLAPDGSATFAGSVILHQGTVVDDETPGLVQATKDIASVSGNQSVVFSKHLCRAGSSNAYMYWKVSGGGTDANALGQWALHASRGADTALNDPAKITLNGNGSATFAGNVISGNPSISQNDKYGAQLICDTNAGVAILNVQNTSTIPDDHKAFALWKGTVDNVVFYPNGDYRFAGTGTTRGLAFNLEPDNPANYTTTTDSEGNETQVYNGPTLDVKEKLMEALATIEDLKTRIAALEA